MGPLAHAGLALATAIASALNFVVLLVVLRRRLGPFGFRRVAWSAGLALLASVPTAVIGWLVSGLAIWEQRGEWLVKIALITLAIGASVGGYALLHAAWKTEEAVAVWDLLKRRRGRAAGPMATE
jgi:putative peptidoglycan lipid II flippase